MKVKRIISFLPSATELIYELGSQDSLYGVTHECKYPKEAQAKPQVINSVVDSENLSSIEIDNQICQLFNKGEEIFILDDKKLLDANPDLIITQKTCEVCAPYENLVDKAIAVLPQKPLVYSMDPHNLDEILTSVTEIGEILGTEKQSENIKKNLEARIAQVRESLKGEKLKVLAIEWIEPFFTSGHWIPEMIEFAGGINLISKKGEHSRKMNFDEILKSDPDIVIFMPCGFSAERTIQEYNKFLKNNNQWNQLQAVKKNKIFAVDANSFFSKPSIRTITGLEILAKIIHPEYFKNITVPKNSYYNMLEPNGA